MKRMMIGMALGVVLVSGCRGKDKVREGTKPAPEGQATGDDKDQPKPETPVNPPSDTGNGNPSNEANDASIPVDSTAELLQTLQGTWRTSCMDLNYPETKAYLVELQFKDKVMTEITTMYLDEACNKAALSTQMEGTYNLGSTSEAVTGAHELDVRVERETTKLIGTDLWFGECNGEDVDITETYVCEKNPVDEVYTVITLDQGKLILGTADGDQDGTTVATRHIKLDTEKLATKAP